MDAKKAKREPEWTHLHRGKKCKIIYSEPDFEGFVLTDTEECVYQLYKLEDLDPIKPTITTSEKEKCAVMASYFNINPAEFDEYISKYEVAND